MIPLFAAAVVVVQAVTFLRMVEVVVGDLVTGREAIIMETGMETQGRN